jgi:type III restriction enzyme
MAMEFRFDATQEYQLAAIEAACGLLEGQPHVRSALVVPDGASFSAIANRLDLSPEDLLKNLQALQEHAGLGKDAALQVIAGAVDTVATSRTVQFPNFSVEMETGTGKTYVYLRTAMELYKRFGLRKFIIVVPSVAVREGVLKTLKVTENHLKALYDNPPYRYYVYDSANLSQVRQFALSDGLELMVMTIDAFARAENVIRQTTDRLQGERPLHLIQATRPVLILDEPQNMESENRIAALASLDPLFALRYSATHRNSYNLIHRLTPFEAYRQGLVKRIEVASVVEENNQNLPFLRLDEVKIQAKKPIARLAVHKLMRSGAIKETVLTIKGDDDLQSKTGRTEYQGFVADEINYGGKFIRFANNVELRVGQATGIEREAIFEAQLRYTIEEHLRKQIRFRDDGIKVLSLFFIDRVDNYAAEDGTIRTVFDRIFDEVKDGYPDWKGRRPEEVRSAYFATKTKKGGATEYLDTTGKSKADEEAFNLIMREKEKLLSFDEPVSFIFSHSALREGWDNPNVFQICTMREVGSDTERRQQVGRGVRLPVNQGGERIRDERINVLTVVASETYERFVAELQGEIEAEYGKEGAPPKPANARKKTTLNLRKAHMLRPEFKQLWEKIRHKTRYAVTIDPEKLIEGVLPDLDAAQIRKPRIAISKAEMIASDEDTFEALTQSGARTAIDLAGRYPLPNLVEIMENLMENTSPPMRVSRKTLLDIYRCSKNRAAALDNPHEFATVAVGFIKARLADQLVDGIRYEKLDEWYEMTQFEAEIETWADYIVPSTASHGAGGTHLYDGVPFDSETIEKPFIEALEKRKDVKLYIKLPSWFTVATPIGGYNPDWAIVMENPDGGEDLLYLVRETKGSLNPDDLRPDERRKIACGRRHFADALDVNYRVVTNAGELPSGGV